MTKAKLTNQAYESPARPGPEQHRLQAFVGQWEAEGEIALSDCDPPSKILSTNTYEWLTGRFFMIHRFHWSIAGGKNIQGIEIIKYDYERRLYIAHFFDSLGLSPTYEITHRDDVWTFNSESERAIVVLRGESMSVTWERPTGARSTWRQFGALRAHRVT